MVVSTSIGDFHPGVIVFATGASPTLPRLPLALPSRWIKGHLLATEPADLRLPGTVSDIASQLDDGRLLAGGTLDVGDDSLGVRDDVILEVRARLDEALPAARHLATTHQWCCFRTGTAGRITDR
jgi:glycine/D-amino acid oxidase-like deaminating enzyme